ncbi:MAG: PD40 domain-containing protein, partial [Anaerolineales bacterium]
MKAVSRTPRYPISRYLNTHAAYFPSFAADGRRVAFITDITGVPQLWQVALSPESDAVLWPDQLSFEAEQRVTGAWFSPAAGDSRLINARDVGGDENVQLYLLLIEDGTEIPLTAGYEGALHIFGEWSRDGSRILFAANRRDPGLFDLYVQPLDGQACLVWQNEAPGFLFNLSFSPDGGRAIAARMASSFHHDLIEIDLMSGTTRLLSHASAPARYDAVCYTPDGRALFVNTDLGSDFLHIARLDLDDGLIEPLVAPGWDAQLMTLSPDGRYLAYDVNVEGASELNLLDLASGTVRTAPELSIRPGVLGMMDQHLVFSPDSSRLAFSFTSATRTSEIFIWDLATDRVRAITQSSHGGIPLDS